ncbi:hypothetical protein [Sphingobium chungangianum]
MGFLTRTFGALDRSYLIRAYLIGLAIFAFYGYFISHGAKSAPISVWVFFTISTLLFPFAKFVWDEIMSLVLGRNMVFMNALVLLVLKLFVNVFLWAAAILIAPLGILYLWIRTRNPAG